MATQNVAYDEYIDDYPGKPPDIDYEEINGIKLRDSLFVVYSEKNPVSQPECYYNLKSINGPGQRVFDYEDGADMSSGGSENCGAYKLQNDKILEITTMKNWHFTGHMFKDEKEWVQYSELIERNDSGIK